MKTAWDAWNILKNYFNLVKDRDVYSEKFNFKYDYVHSKIIYKGNNHYLARMLVNEKHLEIITKR